MQHLWSGEVIPDWASEWKNIFSHIWIGIVPT